MTTTFEQLQAKEAMVEYIETRLKNNPKFKYIDFFLKEDAGYVYLKGKDLLIPQSYVYEGSYLFNVQIFFRLNNTNFYVLAKRDKEELFETLDALIAKNKEVQNYFKNL